MDNPTISLAVIVLMLLGFGAAVEWLGGELRGRFAAFWVGAAVIAGVVGKLL